MSISDQVIETLFSDNMLTLDQLQHSLYAMHQKWVDYADIYAQASYEESWHLSDGIVKDGSFDCSKGIGFRVNVGEKTGFAYTEEWTPTAVEGCVKAALSIAKQKSGQERPLSFRIASALQPLYVQTNPLYSIESAEKVKLLQSLDAYARQADPRIVEVSVSLSASYEAILVLATDQTLQMDIRPLVRLNVKVIASQNGQQVQGYAGGGRRDDYQMFLQDQQAFRYVDEAVRQALVNLAAKPAPAGVMPVVLGPGWPGVLLHEAIGHGLEADFNRKGSSVYSKRMGEKIFSEKCTIVDDGTLSGRRGSLTIDDEGTPTQCTILIEKGVLKNYMFDKLNARLMKQPITGNGRRESYAHIPMPRMTNTYMLPGEDVPEDIIRSVDRGIYAVNFSGGEVDITSGKFVFSANEAYLIEKGQVTAPIKGATLIGAGDVVMQKVSMVGNDLSLDSGVGICGKQGQSVPVGVGQPTIKVDELTVGGTK